MPRQRLRLDHTVEFKIQQVEELLASPLNRVQFCVAKSYARTTLQTWERDLERLKRVAQEQNRSKKLTVGGSGRKSPSEDHEEAIIVWIKERRRENKAVSVLGIIQQCRKLLPEFIENKTLNARRAWCSKMMRRHKLTIRKISHSGRKKRSQLISLKEAFAMEVSTALIQHFLDSATATPPPFVLFNMDQTAVFSQTGVEYTVEFVGASHVAADGAGKGGHRCTVALLVSADGVMHTPHFVFKGEGGGGVFDEVEGFVSPLDAAFSVQTNAWFDERVMMEWIDKVWQYVVTGPSLLLLDSLKVHKCAAVRQRLAEMGTSTYYVPAGCTSVSQPLDVGIMGPFKKDLRDRFEELYSDAPPPETAGERRYDMYKRVMHVLPNITATTIRKSFFKSGPFLPFGPDAPTHGMLSDHEESFEHNSHFLLDIFGANV